MTVRSNPSPWAWIPTLYFTQAIPYAVAMSLSVIMYKKMDISNTDIALYTSWLYLPWVIKPFWSPMVDMIRTKRFWIVSLQFLMGAALAMVALTIPAPHFFQMTLAVFWLMAFSSATHDIAADGFYMMALNQPQQAAFVGVRSAFYRVANIAGQGGLVWLAGRLEDSTGSITQAWTIVFWVICAMFVVMGLFHHLVLPHPVEDVTRSPQGNPWKAYVAVFTEFLTKKDIGRILAFLLLYRFGEAQLVKLAAPFLLDSAERGGLALPTESLGIVYGTVGTVCLTAGGLLGGYAISKGGLKRWLWPMALALNVPHLVYVYLSFALPTNLWLIGLAVGVESLGYGFGFAAYLLTMMMICEGPNKTAHYAICTGFMALGMMLPGMLSGWIQAQLGYAHFFVWVCLAAVPALLATAMLRVDPEFGRKAA